MVEVAAARLAVGQAVGMGEGILGGVGGGTAPTAHVTRSQKRKRDEEEALGVRPSPGPPSTFARCRTPSAV
jgi:hypothetical protein